MKIKKSILFVAIIFFTITIIAFFSACDDDSEKFGYSTNGDLEGTLWIGAGYLSFSKNAVTITQYLDYGSYGIGAGTYYSYINNKKDWLSIADKGHSIYESKKKGSGYTESDYGYRFDMKIDKYYLIYRSYHFYTDGNRGGGACFLPAPGSLFINGPYRYFNDFGAMETESGLAIIEYTGNKKNVIIPDEIGGVPVTEIRTAKISTYADSPFSDYLTSIIIPDSVKIIQPGVFHSRYLRDFLTGGITIGADVEISSDSFYAYENEHNGYWMNMGFVKFYNENGRKAGKYKWTSSYDYYNYEYKISWSFIPY